MPVRWNDGIVGAFLRHFWWKHPWRCDLKKPALETKRNLVFDFKDFFYFHPYLGKWSNLTNIFQMGWNHQLGINTQNSKACPEAAQLALLLRAEVMFGGFCANKSLGNGSSFGDSIVFFETPFGCLWCCVALLFLDTPPYAWCCAGNIF